MDCRILLKKKLKKFLYCCMSHFEIMLVIVVGSAPLNSLICEGWRLTKDLFCERNYVWFKFKVLIAFIIIIIIIIIICF